MSVYLCLRLRNPSDKGLAGAAASKGFPHVHAYQCASAISNLCFREKYGKQTFVVLEILMANINASWWTLHSSLTYKSYF